jgi:hypothetical protein
MTSPIYTKLIAFAASAAASLLATAAFAQCGPNPCGGAWASGYAFSAPQGQAGYAYPSYQAQAYRAQAYPAPSYQGPAYGQPCDDCTPALPVQETTVSGDYNGGVGITDVSGGGGGGGGSQGGFGDISGFNSQMDQVWASANSSANAGVNVNVQNTVNTSASSSANANAYAQSSSNSMSQGGGQP